MINWSVDSQFPVGLYPTSRSMVGSTDEKTAWWTDITVTSHERYGGSNQRQTDCLSQILFKTKTKKAPKICVTGFFFERTPPMDSLQKGPVNLESVSMSWRWYHGSIEEEMNGVPDGLVQNCCISIANALKILQCCTKTLIQCIQYIP